MFVKTYAAALQGINAIPVMVEAQSSVGYEFSLVGLPDNAVRESSQRITAAFSVCRLLWPQKSITINLAPADIKKEGAAYDLPIAVSLLAVDEQLNTNLLESSVLLGELSLDGHLQPIRGALSVAIMARDKGFKRLILPAANAQEAAVVEGVEVYGMNTLREVIGLLSGETVFETAKSLPEGDFGGVNVPDFAEVRGQENVKRALEVAAAGGHNILMVGSPGSGKSMLAKRLPGILPPLTKDEALETTKIHSIAGRVGRGEGLIWQRPFRSPHHTVSDVALTGGGSNPMPGEISLAHNGVLFLDELPEYKKQALEVLRQPLEDRKICIARQKQTVEYPASFMLVAAMNPCPCGYYNDPTRACTCMPGQVHRYLSRISGPLLDRIDIQVEIVPVPFALLQQAQDAEPSAVIRERVIKARQMQQERFAGETGVYCNAQMTPKLLRKYCKLNQDCERTLQYAMESMGLSARAWDRILKVSRTIADLAASPDIQVEHISEAIGYRNLDRNTWGI